MAYQCRCTRKSCRKRVTLKKHPDAYKVYPKCKGCGGHVNHQPTERLYDKLRTCYCGSIRYPHRKGAFINKNEICVHAEVDDTTGDPARIDTMRPGEPCPF